MVEPPDSNWLTATEDIQRERRELIAHVLEIRERFERAWGRDPSLDEVIRELEGPPPIGSSGRS